MKSVFLRNTLIKTGGVACNFISLKAPHLRLRSANEQSEYHRIQPHPELIDRLMQTEWQVLMAKEAVTIAFPVGENCLAGEREDQQGCKHGVNSLRRKICGK
jgi:hypothetical protein